MKARRKGTDNPFVEVKEVGLVNSDILYKAEVMEFEHDALPTEPDWSKLEEDAHWQDIREMAAIAAMQGMLSNPTLVDDISLDYRITIEKTAVAYADELVKQLKNEDRD